MAKFIEKSDIEAEIEKRREEWRYGSSIEAKYKKEECDDILSFLDTLEVKEVDLDKEFDKYCENLYLIDLENEPYAELFECAEHFFELGIKAQKGE